MTGREDGVDLAAFSFQLPGDTSAQLTKTAKHPPLGISPCTFVWPITERQGPDAHITLANVLMQQNRGSHVQLLSAWMEADPSLVAVVVEAASSAPAAGPRRTRHDQETSETNSTRIESGRVGETQSRVATWVKQSPQLRTAVREAVALWMAGGGQQPRESPCRGGKGGHGSKERPQSEGDSTPVTRAVCGACQSDYDARCSACRRMQVTGTRDC